MNRKVLLIFPPGWEPVMPIGLGYLKSFLESNGFLSKIIDLNILFSDELAISEGNSKKKKEILDKAYNILQKEIISYNANIAAFTLLEPTFHNAIYLIKKIKSEFGDDINIVVGGPHTTYLQKRVMDYKSIDVAIPGEGELPLLELMQRLKSSKSINSPSYFTRQRKKVVGGTNSKYIANLDKIPFPDFSDLDFEKYPFPFIISIFGRGCVKKCIFCGVPYIYSTCRYRSLTNIMSEIKRNINEYGFKILAFTDSLLNSNLGLTNKVCNNIIKDKLHINWMAEVLPSISQDSCKIWYKSGCRLLYMAPETGSQKIADTMGKNVNIKETEKSIIYAHNKGIISSTWYIVGFPHENKNDINETFLLMEKTKKYSEEILVSPFGLSINTPIYFHPEKFGVKNIRERGYNLYCTYDTENPELSFNNQMQIVMDMYKKYNPEAYESKMLKTVRNVLKDETASIEEKFLLSESYQFPYKLYGVRFSEDYSYVNLFKECFKDVL